jgi:hypothetical protein
MPKQFMRVRNKQHHGPESPNVATKKRIELASQRGATAWKRGKSITDNPYRPGTENEAWKKAYLQASQYRGAPIENRAPEGKWFLEPNSYVIIKRIGIKKKWGDAPARKQKFNDFLGYIKPGKNGRPRRFHIFTGNPLEDKWRNKVACKSYKPEKEESEGE